MKRVSPKSKPLLALLAISLWITPVWSQRPETAIANSLPALGDGSDITLSAERQLGDRIVRELYRDPDYLEDPILDEYLQSIWQPLVRGAQARGEMTPELQERFAWKIFIGRDRSVNAFALPGGYLGVHLGLISVVTTRDELASVMAHELSHVTQRHIARSIGDQARMTPWLIGAMILGMLAASKSAQGAQAVIVGGQAMAAQSQLNFSRDMEREADRIGYGVMSEAGFDTQGFVTMFGKLQQAAGLNDSGAFPYLRSHPLSSERIADMQGRQQLQTPRPANQANDSVQAIMSARARVLAQPGVGALRAWANEATDTSMETQTLNKRVGILYGAAFSLMQLRDLSAARALLPRLRLALANHASALRLVQLLEMEMAFKENDMRGALRALNTVVQLPASQWQRPELIYVAQASARLQTASPSMETSQLLAKSVSALQAWVLQSPQDAQAWQVLASSLAAQGRTLASLRAEGEAQLARMDFGAAVDRFRAAQDASRKNSPQMGDHIEASIVDSRLRFAQGILREQLLERQAR
ncbi:MAG: M48 family metalloprotease [Burkholderiales bacterium]|nr:M48 family metalloprotease [Burkholderiales bacterium]